MGWVKGREAYRGAFWAHSALCRRAPAPRPGGRAGAVAHSPCGEARAGTRSGGWSGAGARSPRGEARRRYTLWWADRRRCTLPSRGGAASVHAVVGEPAQVHAPLAGRRGVGTPWIGEPAQVHAPLAGRRGAGTRCGGRTGAGARSPRGEARRRYTLDRRTGAVAHFPRGEARRRYTLWWADRRRCTLPSRGGAASVHAVVGEPARLHTPLAGGAASVHAVVGEPAQVHAPLAGRRGVGTRCGGRTGAGARSPRGEARNLGCLSPHGTGHMFVL